MKQIDPVPLHRKSDLPTIKTHFSEKKGSGIILGVMLMVLAQTICFCQNRQNTGQKPQEKTKAQTLTPEQTATIKTILSNYNASKLTAADAKAIHGKFRDAGIHAGTETRDAIRAAGFDPEKLKALDPPKNPDNQGKSAPPTDEERLKTLQEKVIKPLALSSTQNDALNKAYKEFYAGMESLKKTQTNQQGPLDKSKVEPLEKARDEKIRKVLSGDQYVKYLELEKVARPQNANDPEPKRIKM